MQLESLHSCRKTGQPDSYAMRVRGKDNVLAMQSGFWHALQQAKVKQVAVHS